MTSVLNRLQQLNGSKILILFLLAFLTFSCGTTKKTSKRKKTRTSTTKKKRVSKRKKKATKVDTTNWTEIDNTVPITNGPAANPKSSYDISIVMPLGGTSEYIPGENDKIEGYINYYAGVKLALNQLELEGAQLNVRVYDENVNFEKTIYSKAFQASDLIIGPRKKEKLRKVVGIGKRNEALVVSPWWRSSRITKDNPHYLQLNPSPQDRYEALLRHAKANYTNDRIVIIERDDAKDRKRSLFFQNLNSAIDAHETVPLEIFQVNIDSLDSENNAFDELLIPNEDHDIAIIIPNWSSKDEYYLYSCLRKLSVEKANNNITVYAMSKVLESELIGYELYKNLNIRIAADNYIQFDDFNVSEFRSRYFEQYSALPSNEAIEGYDMMMFVGKNLIKYGNRFPLFTTDPQRMSQIKFDINSFHRKSDINDEHYDNIQYYENNHVDILEFMEHHFERKD